MKFHNECYECGFEWDDNSGIEECPECGEWDRVGSDENE